MTPTRPQYPLVCVETGPVAVWHQERVAQTLSAWPDVRWDGGEDGTPVRPLDPIGDLLYAGRAVGRKGPPWARAWGPCHLTQTLNSLITGVFCTMHLYFLHAGCPGGWAYRGSWQAWLVSVWVLARRLGEDGSYCPPQYSKRGHRQGPEPQGQGQGQAGGVSLMGPRERQGRHEGWGWMGTPGRRASRCQGQEDGMAIPWQVEKTSCGASTYCGHWCSAAACPCTPSRHVQTPVFWNKSKGLEPSADAQGAGSHSR